MGRTVKRVPMEVYKRIKTIEERIGVMEKAAGCSLTKFCFPIEQRKKLQEKQIVNKLYSDTPSKPSSDKHSNKVSLLSSSSSFYLYFNFISM